MAKEVREPIAPSEVMAMMAGSFDELVARCREVPCRSHNWQDPEQAVRRTLAFGPKATRLYCHLALVINGTLAHWHAVVMTTKAGHVTEKIVPRVDWSPLHDNHLVNLERLLLALEPKMSVSNLDHGYEFTGPMFPAPVPGSDL